MWMNTQIIALDMNTNTYYTPWFPRGAVNGMFLMEQIQSTLGSTFTVSVSTKNREDEGSEGSSAGSFATLSGSFKEVTCTDLKELVRFKIVTRADSVGQGAIFRFLPPTWYDTAV